MGDHWNVCQMGDPAKANDNIGTVYCMSFYRLYAVVNKAGKTNMMLTLSG